MSATTDFKPHPHRGASHARPDRGPSGPLPDQVDVVIVGAGISGIGMGCRLQERCPDLTYAVLEAREVSGGTWDLFRYPGVRSDSDMFTLSYPFKPWAGKNSIADGGDILDYVREAAEEYGVAAHIHFGHQVVAANWSTPEQRWTLQLKVGGEERVVKAKYVHLASGYYRYDEGYNPEFEGSEDFAGDIVHPQHWPEDLDYTDKKVVVIGSGATAVTVVPAIAEKASLVTMLQRTPSWLIAVPRRDDIANKLRGKVPPRLLHHAVRARNLALTSFYYQLSRHKPEWANEYALAGLRRKLDEDTVEEHFHPDYNVWDQRLCAVPNGDFFRAVRAGKAQVVTNTIDRFVPEGIKLSNGEILEADVIVTATGLQLQTMGGAEVSVDGELVDMPTRFVYRGTMLGGVPNASMTIGYINSSWTLRADLVSKYITSLLSHMSANGYGVAVPVAPQGMKAAPVLDLASGYLQRSIDGFPKIGDRVPWKMPQNYIREMYDFARASVAADMAFFKDGEAISELPASAIAPPVAQSAFADAADAGDAVGEPSVAS